LRTEKPGAIPGCWQGVHSGMPIQSSKNGVASGNLARISDVMTLPSP
jgi:hypothetical protein